MLVLRFSLTPEDHYQFNYYRQWQSPEGKKRKPKYYLSFIGTIMVGYIIVFSFRKGPVTASTIAAYLLCAIIGIILLPHIHRWQLRNQVKKLLANPTNGLYTSPTELLFSDGGITTRGEHSETKYEWNAIVKQEETENHYYLYLTDLLVVTIPKRILSSQEDKLLKDYLSRYVPLEAVLGESAK